MIRIDSTLTPQDLRPRLARVFEIAAAKIKRLHETWDPSRGSPVFTVDGRYTSRGWTEWTQGFQFGAALLHFAATRDTSILDLGRRGTLRHMATHVSHTGVHDHGFNNVSTYGTLLHLAQAGLSPADECLIEVCELALKVSGAVQAARWTELPEAAGFIYSFNGPHSLFADTIRSLRVLALAHRLGHLLMGERDRRISLLDRLLTHAETTARYTVYYGEGRDSYDIRGRVAHESIFNTNDGSYRCPGTQQGYSPFSTWTRGLAWVLCGFAEQLEFLATLPDEEFASRGGKQAVLERMLRPAQATAEFYLEYTPADGVPYWDTGAPGLVHLGDYLDRPADPFNDHEPVDSSAAAIAAQGLLRLGRWMMRSGVSAEGARYFAAGLSIARTLFAEPYLATAPQHQGLLLHAVYHRPNGWDRVPPGRRIPCGEACLWGDYHLLELALMLQCSADGACEYSFFGFQPLHP